MAAFVSKFGLIQGSGAFVASSGVLFPYLNDGADVTPPTLTSPTQGTINELDAEAVVTTNEANGTLYVVASLYSNAPTKAQVKSGLNHLGGAVPNASQAISSTGAKTVSVTSLTGQTVYYFHFMHEDAFANQSTVASSASFQTDNNATHVYDVNTTEIVTEGSSFVITGLNFDSSSTAYITCGGYSDSITITGRTSTTITGSITQQTTAAACFVDTNHSATLTVSHPTYGDDTIALSDYNPVSGYTAYPINATYVNLNPLQSVLARASAASGDQVVLPASFNGNTVTWETVNGYATGRFSLSGGDGTGSFTFEFWDATDGSVLSCVVTINEGEIVLTKVHVGFLVNIGKFMNR